jgi:hypothetical protein
MRPPPVLSCFFWRDLWSAEPADQRKGAKKLGNGLKLDGAEEPPKSRQRAATANLVPTFGRKAKIGVM